ncbi:HRAS-like suppressor 3 [Liparis tanakae]|uniref:HRAS-like suppressor 3 n=1 Tax=Liparis tanakae TaxID=230148 RepID=A0A4Z2EX46_9TELE|nr:HRAS-like suppressor 3 [Liparis tanakae]
MAPTLYDEKPEVGDLIEIFRGSYQHWAVYVGDGFIVHLAPPSEVPGSSSIMSVVAEKALVKKEELWDVVGCDRWEINNSLDQKYKSRPAHVIVREACAQVGQELPYCVFRGNCEHFATELRYGKAESRQVRKAGETVAVAGLAAALFLGVAYMFSGSKKEDKNTE